MADDTRADDIRADDITDRITASETAARLLVAGGLVSAFGAASCCALPVLLGSLGVSSVWLGSLALLAGPHRTALLAAAVICLAGGAGVLLWRRRAASACAPQAVCERRMPNALITGALSVGVVLTVLGLVFG